MPANFSVRLTKEHHVFSAAHFITFNRDICERLHGHNYRVNVVVYGPLDENQYVVDFIALRDELKALTDALDHRMLLPTGHPLLSVTEKATDHGNEIEVIFAPDGRRWIFPAGDCAILPIANTTAELLAQYLGERLIESLTSRVGSSPTKIRVEVDENHGQWGVCELSK
jgi:6-pyruvoyltetrahydropterin/6-carboxytetrahydropterin synthase